MLNNEEEEMFPDWNREEQKKLSKIKCQRCGFPKDPEECSFCRTFNPDGGNGK